MGVERFFDKTVTQQRKASRTSNTVEAWANVSTSVRCCIPPIGPGDSLAFQSEYIRLNITHQMFCWATEDIKIGDRIVDGSDKYMIKLQPKKWGVFYQVYLSEVD